MAEADITEFTAVDRTKDSGFFRRFLDRGNQVPGIVASKPVILEQLRLKEGSHVLDVGCGTGADVFEIAGRIGPSGRVVGIDVSEAMIAEARARAQARAISATFEICDAQSLPFQDETFDATRAERTLMHVPDAVRAVSEMVRVTSYGGRVAVFDFDWDTMIVDSPYKDTTRKITRSFSDAFKNGCIGRQLRRVFNENGLVDVSLSATTIFVDYDFLILLLGGHVANAQIAGAVSPGEAEAWWARLAEAHEAGTFFCSFTAFIVGGTRGEASRPPGKAAL